MYTQPNPQDLLQPGAHNLSLVNLAVASPPTSVGQALINRNKTILIAALQSMGAKVVEIEYEGSGDEGSVSSVWATSSPSFAQEDNPEMTDRLEQEKVDTWNPVIPHWDLFSAPENIELKTGTLLDALMDFAWYVLETKKPGWEINEGSNGTVTINLVENTVSLDHSAVYRECDSIEI